METPKEIYILQIKKDGTMGCGWHDHYLESNTCNCVKYIRADLAGLTWEDIGLIVRLNEDVMAEAGGTPKDFFEEVLRRFNESKGIVL